MNGKLTCPNCKKPFYFGQVEDGEIVTAVIASNRLDKHKADECTAPKRQRRNTMVQSDSRRGAKRH